MPKKKTACVLRWGAFGDHLVTSCLYPVLKEDGYTITCDIKKMGMQVLKLNPHISKIHVQPEGIVFKDQAELDEYWMNAGKGFDKYLNMSGTLEGGLLPSENMPEFHLSKEERNEKFNRNYYDYALEVAGYPEIKGRRGELYWSPMELHYAREFRKKHLGQFLILWSLSGSSYHKAYPWAEYVAKEFLNRHEDAFILQTGDGFAVMIGWEHPRSKCYAGLWDVREGACMTQFADLVISTETSIAHASGIYPTPKIIIHSHSTPEKLTKYFDNCIDLSAGVHCQPCHQLIHKREYCPIDPVTQAPICMAYLKPERVLEAMETVYGEWQSSRKYRRAA